MKFNLYFRANESAKSAGSTNEDITKESYRIGTHTKEDILRAVWLSVNNSGITNEDRIRIFCDAVSSETITWMANQLKTEDFEFKEVPPLSYCPGFESHPFPDLHPVRINCSLALFKLFYEEIEAGEDDDVFHLCEDDYLHRAGALQVAKQLYLNGYKGFFLPYDYPDRYTLDTNRKAEVILGPGIHLRSVPSATFTMMADKQTWMRFKLDGIRGSVFCDDGWTWKAFSQVAAVCPIPGLSCHFQEGYISPYINWDEIFKWAMSHEQ